MISNLVSVIIPCFNRQETIEKAITSVLNQTYKDIEVIIVDDCSYDNSVNVIREIKDDRITVYELNENRGACFARNYGVSKARGEFIAFQDSDDIWKEEKIERQLNYLKQNNLDFVSTAFTRYENGIGTMYGYVDCPHDKESLFKKLLDHNWVSTQTILCYSECFNKIAFDPEIRRFQDWDLALQASEYFSLGSLNESLVDVYLQNDSITNNNSDSEKLKVLRKYYNRAFKISKSTKAQFYKTLADATRKKRNIKSAYFYYKSFCLEPNMKVGVWSVLSLFGFGRIYRAKK